MQYTKSTNYLYDNLLPQPFTVFMKHELKFRQLMCIWV